MAKTSILTIMIQLAKQGDADRATIKSLAQLKANVGLAMGAFSAFTGVAVGVGAALGKSGSTFVDYAAQVRELSRLTGATADETSRLIQVADDMTISYESLQKALWAASKNGIEVNIDGLAALADEYNALGSATEQAAFLAEKFGKSGAEMGKLMEMGASGIRAAADATSESLVLTERAVQQAREYEVQVDSLTDSWQAFKMTIGQAVVPELNNIIFGMQHFIDIAKEAAFLIGENNTSNSELTTSQQAYNREQTKTTSQQAFLNVKIREYTDGLDSAGMSYRGMAEQAAIAAGANLDFGTSLDVVGQKNQDLMSQIMNLQSETDAYNQKNEELKLKLQELTAEQANYTDGSTKYNAIQTEIDETKSAVDQLAAQHEDAGRRIAFSLLQQKMAVDGLTDTEFEALLGMGMQWGILDEKVVE